MSAPARRRERLSADGPPHDAPDRRWRRERATEPMPIGRSPTSARRPIGGIGPERPERPRRSVVAKEKMAGTRPPRLSRLDGYTRKIHGTCNMDTRSRPRNICLGRAFGRAPSTAPVIKPCLRCPGSEPPSRFHPRSLLEHPVAIPRRGPRLVPREVPATKAARRESRLQESGSYPRLDPRTSRAPCQLSCSASLFPNAGSLTLTQASYLFADSLASDSSEPDRMQETLCVIRATVRHLSRHLRQISCGSLTSGFSPRIDSVTDPSDA